MHDEYTIRVVQRRGSYRRNDIFFVSGLSEGEAINFALARVQRLPGATEPEATVIGRASVATPERS
jgi:hypothetical protein